MCAYLAPFGEPLPMEKRPRKDWRGPLLEKVELAGNRNRNRRQRQCASRTTRPAGITGKAPLAVPRGGRNVKPKKANVQNMIWLP